MPSIHRSPVVRVAFALLGTLGATLVPAANDRESRSGLPRFVARMTPMQEVPPISSPARGSFSATIDEAASTISFELRYEAIASGVEQAHLHTAQPGVNGGIMVWLCGTAASPGPPGTPECPASQGVVEGVLTSEQIVGPAAQGISPGEFDEVLRAIRNGVVYANVHTTRYPSGEIRGQLRRGMTLATAESADRGPGGSAQRDQADGWPPAESASGPRGAADDPAPAGGSHGSGLPAEDDDDTSGDGGADAA